MAVSLAPSQRSQPRRAAIIMPSVLNGHCGNGQSSCQQSRKIGVFFFPRRQAVNSRLATSPSWTYGKGPGRTSPLAAVDGRHQGHFNIQHTSVAVGNGAAASRRTGAPQRRERGAAGGSVEPTRLLPLEVFGFSELFLHLRAEVEHPHTPPPHTPHTAHKYSIN